MKKRIIIAVVAVLVVAVAGAGIAIYVYKNTGEKLLWKAKLALQAGNLQRAVDLSARYISQTPEDWQGYSTHGEALLAQGRYEDARGALNEAIRLDPARASIQVTLSKTYSRPAYQVLPAGRNASMESLRAAVAGLTEANRILAEAKPVVGHDELSVGQELGLNLEMLGKVHKAIADRFHEEAKIAGAAERETEQQAKLEAAAAATADAGMALAKATEALLKVVTKDPSRALAAQALVALCVETGDSKSLAAASDVLLSADVGSPAAKVMLLTHDLGKSLLGKTAAERRAMLEDAAATLDKLHEANPEEVQVQLARAQIALQLGDTSKTDQICDEVLKVQDRHAEIRLLKARSLMVQNKPAEAERILFELKTERHDVPAVFYYYALAAQATGKKELAKEAMRTVVNLQPDHAEARRFLAESLLEEGYYKEALTDARAYHEAHPDDPAAIHAYIASCEGTGQTDLARAAITAVRENFADQPGPMLTAGEGLLRLGEAKEAAAVFALVADMEPKNLLDTFFVARARLFAGRASEAETLLVDALQKDPESSLTHYAMGMLLGGTGRHMQALEHYRKAVQLDPHNTQFRLSVAQTLSNLGRLTDCMTECKGILAISPMHLEASVLYERCRSVLGMPADHEVVLPPAAAQGKNALRMAMTELRYGDPQKCVDVCLEELKRAPADVNVQLLLADGYMALGKKDKGVEQLSKLIEANPDQLALYFRLADVLAMEADPEQVQRSLQDISGAKAEMVDFAVARLHVRARDFASAAGVYARLAGRTGVSADARNQARLERANALAAGGRLDLAITELAELATTEEWRKQALKAQAQLLVAARRPDEAVVILDRLSDQAVADKDAALLEGVVRTLVLARRMDKAAETCRRLRQLAPRDAKPYLLTASVCLGAQQMDEAASWYEKAIALQPGNLNARIMLARVHDAQQKSPEALKVLDELSACGESGQTYAQFERARLFAQWGLQAQAVECLEDLVEKGYGADPDLKQRLASAFAALGKKDIARRLLEEIPEYSDAYMRSQLLLADLADSPETKLAILAGLERKKPGSVGLLIEKMRVLSGEGMLKEAVQEFRDFEARFLRGNVVPLPLAEAALALLVEVGDEEAAAGLAQRLAKETNTGIWQYRAILLTLAVDADKAAAALPEIGKTDVSGALLGLAVTAQKGDMEAAGRWARRLDQLDQQLLGAPGVRPLPPGHKILVALAVGDTDRAKLILENVTRVGGLIGSAATELIATVHADPGASVEASRLLQCLLAQDLMTPRHAVNLAWKLLEARNTCQWAAAVIVGAVRDTESLEKVQRLLEPKDGLLAGYVSAEILLAGNEPMKAAEIYRKAAEAHPGDYDIVLNQARAVEAAGMYPEALNLYRKAWEEGRKLIAANNGAYMITQVFPDDPERLKEADKWMAEVMSASPNTPSFLDTKGWISYLRGDKADALKIVRRAVVGLSVHPEVHYHLGVIEADAGNADLARWHLEAVRVLVNARKQGREPAPATDEKVARLAREALAKLPQGAL